VTDLLEVTAVALGLARVAYMAAMVDDLMGEGDPPILGDDLHQLLLDFFGCFTFGEAKAAGDAQYMRIDDDTFRHAETNAQNHIRCFSSSAGDGDEFSEGLRNLTIEVGDDLAGCALNRLCLVAKEAGRPDEGFELRQSGFRHGSRGREATEELGRDHVDTDVGTLRGKDGGDQQLPRGVVREGAFDFRIGFVETFEDGGYAVGGKVAVLGLLCRFLRG